MCKLLSALIFISSLLATTLVNAQEKSYRLELSEPGKPVQLDLEIHNGAILVEGYDGETVEIIVNARASDKQDLQWINKDNSSDRWNGDKNQNNPKNKDNNKTERSTQGLKQISNNAMQVSVKENRNRIKIESERSAHYVDIKVKIPKRAAVSAELYSGDGIIVNNISGSLELESFKGGINASNVSGPIVAETYNADIVVVFDNFNEVNPSSLASHSGSIDISLSKNMKAKIKVQNYQGEIFSGLGQEFKPEDEVKRNKDGDRQEIIVGSQLSAQLNGGTQTLTLTTYSGNLYIRK